MSVRGRRRRARALPIVRVRLDGYTAREGRMREECILERQCGARKLCDVLALEPTGHGADSRHKAAANLIG